MADSQNGFCIFHEESDLKDASSFRERIQQKLDKGDYDFSGYCFPNQTGFQSTTFSGKVSFAESSFAGNVSFCEASFTDDVSFVDARFAGDLSFEKAQFQGARADFTRAKFGMPGSSLFSGFQTKFDDAVFAGNEARFDEAVFAGSAATFCGTVFECPYVSFRQVSFEVRDRLFFLKTVFAASECTDFTGARFLAAHTCFEDAHFQGVLTTFWGAQFKGEELSFYSARFAAKSAYFNEVLFSSNQTKFRCAEFSGDKTIFSESKFVSGIIDLSLTDFHASETFFHNAIFSAESVDFKECRFRGQYTGFAGASFSCEVKFDEASFSGERTVFANADFSRGYVSFDGSRFSATDTDFGWYGIHCRKSSGGHVVFHAATFLPGRVSFCGRDLDGWRFPGARWDRADFSSTIWPSRGHRAAICTDEVLARKPQKSVKGERRNQFRIAEGVCRNIKQSLQMTGNYKEAGEFYYGEMECARLSQDIFTRERFRLLFFKLLCGYGERPLWVLFVGLATVIVFALMHMWRTIIETGTSNLTHDFLTCLYFSGVTFTTLGFGDFCPTGTLGRIFSVSEASLGAVLLALFTVSISRKFSR